MLVVQGTVLTARHVSKSYKHLSFSELTQSVDIPVVAGNCVDYATALELMGPSAVRPVSRKGETATAVSPRISRASSSGTPENVWRRATRV